MVTHWRIAICGIILLACAVLTLEFRLELSPVLGTPPNPETPNLFPSEIRSHLMALTGIGTISASAGVLCLTLQSFLKHRTRRDAQLLRLSSWLLRLTLGAMGVPVAWRLGRQG